MRVVKIVVFSAIVATVGCVTVRHTENCTESCLGAGKERAIEHLTARLEENRAELETIDDPARRYVVLEIIAGLEAHIEYIKARQN